MDPLLERFKACLKRFLENQCVEIIIAALKQTMPPRCGGFSTIPESLHKENISFVLEASVAANTSRCW